MGKSKPPTQERALIVQHAAKRPYGARARIHVQTAASIGDVEGVTLLLDNGAFITIEPRKKGPWEGGDKFTLTLEGFPTAAAAEAGGRRLVQSMLWTAISLNFGLRFEYSTYEPTAIFDRTASRGVTAEGFGTVGRSVDRVLNELHESYMDLGDPDPALLLSMEIFAGARVEISERARFLAIVSALEPLAENHSLGEEVSGFVDACIAALNADAAIPVPARASVRGRLEHLRTESVRQAILRVVRETLPARADAPGLVDEGYAVRSQIVHEGRPSDLDVDLEDLGRKVGGILRELYSARLNRRLCAAVV